MFNRWFQGRYGVDQLSRALIIASLIVSVISWFFGRAPAGVYYALRGITLALIAFALFRMLQPKLYARQQGAGPVYEHGAQRAQLVQTLRIRRRSFVNVQKEKKKQILHLPPVHAEAPGTQGQGRIRVTCSSAAKGLRQRAENALSHST